MKNVFKIFVIAATAAAIGFTMVACENTVTGRLHDLSRLPNPQADSLAASINSWNHGGTGSLTATTRGSVITVMGSVNYTDWRLTLNINIPAGVTVRWEADLSNEGSSTGFSLRDSAGTLEIAAGSISGNYGISIRGGNPTLKMTGGTITGGNCFDIENTTATIVISGGTIMGGSFGIIYGNNSSGTITVMGNPIITGSVYGAICYNQSSTVIGYYGSDANKAPFDDGNKSDYGGWTEGVNLFPLN
jgi:hypothetical protein